MKIKALLHDNFITTGRVFMTLFTLVGAVGMFSNNHIWSTGMYLLYTTLLYNLIISTRMSDLCILNVTRSDILKSYHIGNMILQGSYLVLAAFFALLSALLITTNADSDIICISFFTILIFIFGLFNISLSTLKYIKNRLFAGILTFAAFISITVLYFFLMSFISSGSAMSNTALGLLLNNNNVENLGAQLGLFFGAIAFYFISTFGGFKIGLKLLLKLDITPQSVN